MRCSFILTNDLVEERAVGNAMSILQIGVSVSEIKDILLGGILAVLLSNFLCLF